MSVFRLLAFLREALGRTRWTVVGSSVVAVGAALAVSTALSCGDDDEGDDLEGTENGVGSAVASPGPVGGAQPPGATIRPPSAITGADLPDITTQADILFTDLATGKQAFEVEVDGEYSANPKGSITPIVGGQDWQQFVQANLRRLSEQGYTAVEVYAVEGNGALYLQSNTLEPLVHQGFDYDSQYGGDPSSEELTVEEEEAKQRYFAVGDLLPTVVREAHAAGLKVTALVESLAHVINRASGEGIGGSGGLVIAGNLPAPSVVQVLAFVDEVIATGVDAISAEAFSSEYDTAIASHLAAKGVPYVHTGADLGTMWYGYYYSFYPDAPGAGAVYQYLHSDCALLGTTNGTVFARARALSPSPQIAVVVGSYNPLSCDTGVSLGDVYVSDREVPVDENEPKLADGSAVANCATGPWKNLLLVAARRQGVDLIHLTADMPASIAETSRETTGQDILQRIAAHPAPDAPLPIANIIFDLPVFTDDDGFTAADVFDAASLGVVGLVDDALQAAGFQTVLTYDERWEGGVVSLTYIITAGGNEQTDAIAGLGPPYWSRAQELPEDLLKLLDPVEYPGPVFLHPLFGVPEGEIPATGEPSLLSSSGETWQKVREQFGLPERFVFKNPALSSYEEYQTSLLTSMPVTPEGEVSEDKPARPVTPRSGEVLGRPMLLSPLTDFYGLGQVANFQAADRFGGLAFAAGPLRVPDDADSAAEQEGVYMVADGQGRFLWLVNQLHHEAFTFIVGQAVGQALDRPSVLVEPAKAHVWSGVQTFALAYDKTDVKLRLPFEAGERIDVTVYDLRSDPIREDKGVAYQEPLTVSLDKYSLLVVEPAR